MTLIVGVRGIRKSYLAADSRVTNTADNTIRDNVSKWQAMGRYSACVFAGNALLAAYLIDAVLGATGDEPSYAQVKSTFDTRLEDFAKQFNHETGYFRRCVVMLSGYDRDKQDDFDAVKMGKIWGAGVKKYGEGQTVRQSVDPEIIKSMRYAFSMAEILHKPTGPQAGDRLSVNYPKSELTAYEVDISSSGVHIDTITADTYEALIFGMDTATNKLELPEEVISDLYFREVNNADVASHLQMDAIHFVSFINEVTRRRHYRGVGGNIISIVITPDWASLPSGQVERLDLRSQKKKLMNDIKVIGHKLCYRDKEGNYQPYISLRELKSENALTSEMDL